MQVILRAREGLRRRADDLRITRVFPCVARGFKARASFMFAGCCWWRSLAVDGYSGASRGHAPVARRPSSWRGCADERSSVFQAGYIPSWRGSCERYALSPVAAACRWSLLLLSPLLSTRRRPPISKPTRTLQGMARVESGQAPAWPSGSDRRRHRGSAVRGGRRPFPAETRSALDGGGVPPHPQRAIPGTSPGRSGSCDDRRVNSGEDRG